MTLLLQVLDIHLVGQLRCHFFIGFSILAWQSYKGSTPG
jgi:hypothetical protein